MDSHTPAPTQPIYLTHHQPTNHRTTDNLVSKLNAQKGSTAGDIIKEMGLYNLFTRGLGLRIIMIGTLTGLQVRGFVCLCVSCEDRVCMLANSVCCMLAEHTRKLVWHGLGVVTQGGGGTLDSGQHAPTLLMSGAFNTATANGCQSNSICVPPFNLKHLRHGCVLTQAACVSSPARLVLLLSVSVYLFPFACLSSVLFKIAICSGASTMPSRSQLDCQPLAPRCHSPPSKRKDAWALRAFLVLVLVLVLLMLAAASQRISIRQQAACVGAPGSSSCSRRCHVRGCAETACCTCNQNRLVG